MKKVVHSFIVLNSGGLKLFNTSVLVLTWMYSAIRWKEDGYKLVMYVDREGYEYMKLLKLDILYDEIIIEQTEKWKKEEDINWHRAWASIKLLSYYDQLIKNPEDEIIAADLDLFLTKPFNIFSSNSDVVLAADIEKWNIYPTIKRYPLPDGYALPEWYTGDVLPYNTGIIYFKNNLHAIKATSEILKIVRHNHKLGDSDMAYPMCNFEQRTIAEYCNANNLKIVCIFPHHEKDCGRQYLYYHTNGLHWMGYKREVTGFFENAYVRGLLKMIRSYNIEYYKAIEDNILWNDHCKELINDDTNILPDIHEWQHIEDLMLGDK